MSINNLLENIVRKQSKNVDFDFSKSFTQNSVNRDSDISSLPVNVSNSSWQKVNIGGSTGLHKRLTFQSLDHILYFINEVMKEYEKYNHDPEFKIDGKDISIFLTTHDLNDVSEIDLYLSKFIDEIYEDIEFL